MPNTKRKPPGFVTLGAVVSLGVEEGCYPEGRRLLGT